MKIIIDFENENISKYQFEAIIKMFDCLFKKTSIQFINYNLVNDTIESCINTQFFLKAMAENLKQNEV
jgi:hypothetical protein